MKGELNMEISNTIKYVGVNDHEIDLFEGQVYSRKWYGIQFLCNY